MEKQPKTIRLVYPQWQGALITPLVPELKDEKEASQGYYLGARLLNFLAPDNGQETMTVPIATNYGPRTAEDGVSDRDTLVQQSRTALEMLRTARPDRIVTLGGECSVSVVPFTYLAEKYQGDVAMIWIDAHPDITLPGDVYAGYHAMAVTAIMGEGEQQLMSVLPARIDPQHILYVGIRNWEREEIKERQKQYGIAQVLKEEVMQNSDAVLRWLEQCPASHVVIHLDMDVFDPAEIIAAVGTDPDGLSMEQTLRIINDIAQAKEVVGLTVAEAMPRTAIRLQKLLSRLPLLR